MYIIEAIPIQHLPKNVSQILSYYHKTSLEKGAIIEISVQTKKIWALVLSSTPIENVKGNLKSNTYTLKKINKVVLSESVVDKTFWTIAKFISSYYFDDLTRVIKLLLPNNLSSLIKYLNKPILNNESSELIINLEINKIFDQTFYQNIINTFNNKKSILLAFPTEAELNFCYGHLKSIFNEDHFVVLNKKITIKNLNYWYSQLLNNKPKIVLGLRKTLGFPLNNLGLIYIFNSQSENYKSWDMRPYLNYETVLTWFSKKNNIPIYFQKNQLYQNLTKKLNLNINLFDTVLIKNEPRVQIIINQDYNKTDLLGYSIKQDIFKFINNQHKWLIFLNKKGFWNGVMCQKCKTILYCPKCNKPLTYFKTKKENYLKCSLCNEKLPIISTCPKCKSKDFIPTNLGIDKLEQNILSLLKEKHIPVFNIQAENTDIEIENNINNFLKNPNGILIGTSIVLRPQINKIDNVAILNIDNLFSIPDFKTEEKILNLLWNLKSIAIKNIYIKTNLKNNNIFQTIKNNTFNEFWSDELILRKKYSLPPFSQIINIEYRHKDQNIAKETIELYSNKIKRTIEKNNLNDKFILTPISPNFHEKIDNQYYWNFKIKMKLTKPALIEINDIKMRNQILNILTSDFYIDVDPI